MIVTRYLGSHLEETLATSELKVAKVSDFNDPFEFRFRYEGEYGRSQAVNDFLKRLNTTEFWQRFQNDPRFVGQSNDTIFEKLEQNLDGILDALVAESVSGHRQMVDGAHQAADQTTRIICFSKPSDDPNNDLLRWSHYSNCHKGARIWLDLSKQEPPLQIGYPVTYSNLPVTIDISRTLDTAYVKEKFKESMATKAECWEYEGEVRSFIPAPLFISRESCNGVVDFVRFNLRGVIRIDFGIRYPPEEVSHIINTYGSNLSETIRFFQATCSYNEYRINYHKVKAQRARSDGPP